MGVSLGAVAVEHFLPLHHVAAAAVFLDQAGDVVAPLAVASGTFDAEHVELSLDVAEDQKVTGRSGPYGGDRSHRRGRGTVAALICGRVAHPSPGYTAIQRSSFFCGVIPCDEIALKNSFCRPTTNASSLSWSSVVRRGRALGKSSLNNSALSRTSESLGALTTA